MQARDMEPERLPARVLRQQHERRVFYLDVLDNNVGIRAPAASPVLPLAFGWNVDLHSLQRYEINGFLRFKQHAEIDREENFLDSEQRWTAGIAPVSHRESVALHGHNCAA